MLRAIYRNWSTFVASFTGKPPRLTIAGPVAMAQAMGKSSDEVRTLFGDPYIETTDGKITCWEYRCADVPFKVAFEDGKYVGAETKVGGRIVRSGRIH